MHAAASIGPAGARASSPRSPASDVEAAPRSGRASRTIASAESLKSLLTTAIGRSSLIAAFDSDDAASEVRIAALEAAACDGSRPNSGCRDWLDALELAASRANGFFRQRPHGKRSPDGFEPATDRGAFGAADAANAFELSSADKSAPFGPAADWASCGASGMISSFDCGLD